MHLRQLQISCNLMCAYSIAAWQVLDGSGWICGLHWFSHPLQLPRPAQLDSSRQSSQPGKPNVSKVKTILSTCQQRIPECKL